MRNACMVRKESLSPEDCHRSYTSHLVHDKNETCDMCFTFQSSHSLVPCSVLHHFDSISKHTSHSLYGQEFKSTEHSRPLLHRLPVSTFSCTFKNS
jgi:hypothetical protein